MDANELFRAALQHFVSTQHLPGPELKRLQDAKLRDLLRHAVKHVPFYRDFYREHGVSAETIVDGEDLWRLPSVTKSDYLRVGSSNYVDERQEIGQLRRRTTSGSLGRALAIYATQEEEVRLRASLWSAWLSLGITSRDRLFMMAAPYLARPLPPIRSDFAAVQMSIDEVIERFRALQPTAIIGSVESIALLAVEVRRRDLPERHGVRRIFPFGQTLSLQLKQMIQRGFDAEVLNLYGATETSWLGHECERHDGLHVNANRVIVHVARLGHPDQPAAPGELGEVIVTSLLCRTTPFIRYRLHDAAALDPTPCPCGRSTPRLKSLEGRVQDFLLSTTGQWVGPGAIAIDLSAGQEAIIDHRVVQEAQDRVRVSIVPAAHFGEPDRQRIEQVVLRHLGAVVVVINLVEEIPRETSGKRRRIYRAFDLEMTS
jgi:phenylacetate-CoA ligase